MQGQEPRIQASCSHVDTRHPAPRLTCWAKQPPPWTFWNIYSAVKLSVLDRMCGSMVTCLMQIVNQSSQLQRNLWNRLLSCHPLPSYLCCHFSSKDQLKSFSFILPFLQELIGALLISLASREVRIARKKKFLCCSCINLPFVSVISLIKTR